MWSHITLRWINSYFGFSGSTAFTSVISYKATRSGKKYVFWFSVKVCFWHSTQKKRSARYCSKQINSKQPCIIFESWGLNVDPKIGCPEILRGFRRFLRLTALEVPKIRSRHLPLLFVPIHYCTVWNDRRVFKYIINYWWNRFRILRTFFVKDLPCHRPHNTR
jgi:hypothetical protein